MRHILSTPDQVRNTKAIYRCIIGSIKKESSYLSKLSALLASFSILTIIGFLRRNKGKDYSYDILGDLEIDQLVNEVAGEVMRLCTDEERRNIMEDVLGDRPR